MTSLQPRRKSASVSAFSTQNSKNINHNKNQYQKLSISKSVIAFNNLQNSQTQRYNQSTKKRPFNQDISNNNNKTLPNNNTSLSYKQAIQKRKKKSLLISNSNNNSYKKSFNEQLLSTIDTFQQVLCSLPLDKLILSQNPFYWVQEQVKTLEKLREKFQRVDKLLKQQTRTYYWSKLQNVTKVLKNIKDNLQTLSKMSKLKNYTSGGTSLDSRNSQSSLSLGWKSTDMRDMNEGMFRNGQVSPHFSIESGNDRDKQNQINLGNTLTYNFTKQKEIKKQKNKSKQKQLITLKDYDQKSRQISEKENLILRQSYRTQKMSQDDQMCTRGNYHTQKSYQQMSQNSCSHPNSNIGKSQNGKYYHYELRKGQLKETKQNKFNGVYQNNYSNKADDDQPLWSLKTMNKTVSKYHQKDINNDIHKYKHNEINNHFESQQQSKETFNTLQVQQNTSQTFQSSLINQSEQEHGENTKRYPAKSNHLISNNNLATEFNFNHISFNTQKHENQQFLKLTIQRLSNQLKLKNDILLNIQAQKEKAISLLSQQFAKKQKRYLQTIYELKTDNESKQNSIKTLLYEKQQQQEQFEIILKQFKQNLQTNKQNQTKQNTLKLSIETLTQQIKLSKVREQELRQTVHLQRQRTKSFKKQLQDIEKQVERLSQMIKTKQIQLSDMKSRCSSLEKKNQQLLMESEKTKSKQDIYKIKYFKLFADFQLFKQKVTETQHYWKNICLTCKKEYKQAEKNNDSQKQIELKQIINFHKQLLVNHNH